MLLQTLLIPVLTAAMIAISPRAAAKRLATLGSLGFLAVTVLTGVRFNWADPAAHQFVTEYLVIPTGDGPPIALSVGVDAVSMMLILLTGLLAPLCVIGSYTAVSERERSYYGWLIALQAPMAAVFMARDLVTFYVGFEFTLIPMFVLISLFGSTNRRKAAVKFFLYTFTGSMMTLVGLLYVVWFNAAAMGPGAGGGGIVPGVGTWTVAVEPLMYAARSMSLGEQSWVLLALMAGFAVKTPLFPVHTWLPLAHTEAPTAGSVVLAGVLLKLGTYGLYRFVVPFVPEAVAHYAPVIAGVSVVGVLYGGLICWVQRDVKKLVAYSSVAHLGFCVLGLFAVHPTGASGSVLYMLNHGLSTGALFFCIGMMYERYHTRSMDEIGGLARIMPVWATFMVFFTMASVGLPGLNGFVSEFFCLMGAYQSGASWGVGGSTGPLGPWYAAIAGVGMIIAAMYLLYMLGKVVFGPPKEPAGHGHGHSHDAHGALPKDLTPREIGVLAPLAILCVALGVYPTPVLRALEVPVLQTIGPARAAFDARPPPAPRLLHGASQKPAPGAAPASAASPEPRP